MSSDYALEPKWDPLLLQEDIIKFDISTIGEDELGWRIEPLQARATRLLAEKVETEAQYRLYRELGFGLFHGYYFCRPQFVRGRRLSETRWSFEGCRQRRSASTICRVPNSRFNPGR